jgi:hypothetical protein
VSDRNLLDQMGMTYFEVDVELDRIIKGDITAAQSRIDGLDADQVRIYAECMRNGDVFPEIVVEATKSARMRVLSGNHRVEAARAIGLKSIPGLLVTPTDAQRDMIVGGANNRHGKPITMDDRKAQACRKVEVFGWTHEEAGRMFGISAAVVGNAISSRRARQRWEQLLPDGPAKQRVPSDNRINLIGRLRSDEAFLACAEVMSDLTSETLQELVGESNRKRKESDAVAVFAEAAQAMRDRQHAAGMTTKAPVSLTSQVMKQERSLARITREQLRSQPKAEATETRLVLHRMQMYIGSLLDERV